MRKRFETQRRLDATPIGEVKIDMKSRHQLPALLAGLQYIFMTPSLNEEVFEILESKIQRDKKSTGRPGMSLWEILVLGTVRLNLDVDYDMLYDQANNHKMLRGILGVDDKGIFEEGRYYPIQTLKDNVALLDEATLDKIIVIVAKAGHALKKKESDDGEPLELHLKSDTYAVESNIHFPTDINLLWDSARKCLDTIVLLQKEVKLSGWRKLKAWYRKTKNQYRSLSLVHQKKGANYKERLEKSAASYLETTAGLRTRVEVSIAESWGADALLTTQLSYYYGMLCKHIDLLERRVIKGEKIPHSEKVFSIFEQHTEWIQKGKAHNKVELGHNVLVTTDQFGFINDCQTIEGQSDKALPPMLVERLANTFETGYKFGSISFDRGFYSALGKTAVAKVFQKTVMPKPGKKTDAQQTEEQTPEFIALRHKHSAIESNINELEHSGVNRVPDKGLNAFKRYVKMGVVAYNLKRLGRLVMDKKLLTTLNTPAVPLKMAA